MAWSIKFDRKAERELEDLDPQIARRISRFLFERIAPLENPRSIGEALKGDELGEFWKYRVGDYRIIVRIEDELIEILVIRIGNRREIYR
ncbi:MAG: type II toxin-antitoxin system RelE/ParE family toxin [Terracidiphilus sp.]